MIVHRVQEQTDRTVHRPSWMAWRCRLRTAVRICAVVGLLMCTGDVAALEPEPLTLNVSPETVRMGAFYNGATVRLQGKTAPACGILIVIRGDIKDEFFNRKERVGPIWINTDKIHITAVPSIFLSLSTTSADALLDRASINDYQLDEAAVRSQLICRRHCKCSVTRHADRKVPCMGVEPEPQYAELIRSSYISLKHDRGAYQTHPAAVRVLDAAEGSSDYDVEFQWPKSAPPGAYRVEVYACRNKAVFARATGVINVVEVGFPAELAALAENHSAIYGTIAVLAAVLAGFAIDALTAHFRRPSRPKQSAREPE